MGTNFYWYAKEHAPCSHCGRAEESERLHIGKSSAGWCFSLHVIPDSGINSLEDWRDRFAVDGSKIRDEYGEEIAPNDMLARITNRSWKPFGKGRFAGYGSEEEFHRRNYSERGPKGLLRHKIDSRYCVGHGEGTWDLCPGEFS